MASTIPDFAQPDFAKLKAGMKSTWMAGDFGRIANFSAQAADDFVQRLVIQTGARVLDVACGTGNTAIPAARAGGSVTGCDIASNLLDQAELRAVAENLDITFKEGDAEDLPFPADSFDVDILAGLRFKKTDRSFCYVGAESASQAFVSSDDDEQNVLLGTLR